MPKICGNIPTVHVSAALAFWLLSGCAEPEIHDIVLDLRVHSLPSVPVPAPAELQLAALGDFPTSDATTASVPLSAQNVTLDFPNDTLALQAIAQPESSDQAFIGFSERGSAGLDFLLWPEGSACELFRASSYPAGLGGEALGFGSSSGLLLIAGSEGFSSSAVVGAMTFDARTGQSRVVDPRAAMRQPRSFASITGFAEQLLVAGGEYPIHESGPASVFNDTAEVYDPAKSSFETDFVPLALGVARHAAVLLESGETALIGGTTTASAASNFIQVVSPLTRTSRLLGTLALGRRAPTVLRLEDGRLFVAGGEDATGSPVGALEWRAADTSPLPAPFDGSISLPPRFDRAYASLPGSAVLAVGGCEERAADPGEDCSRECQRGCPPRSKAAGSGRYEAFWIAADGAVSALNLPLGAGRPSLLPGSDGSPWLIADGGEPGGASSPASRLALYRFNPWQATFERAGIDLGLGQELAAPRWVAMGLDSFAWLAEDAQGVVLNGLRLGTRSAFSSDVPLVTLRHAGDPLRPAHLVPDRPPSADLSYEGAPATLAFASSASGAAKTCVWISDAVFGDFTAEFAFSSSVTPSLRLGTTEFVDPTTDGANGACLLPALTNAGEGGRILLKRAGNQAALTIGSAHSECLVSSQRLAVAVCASELGPVRVTRVSVTR
ncbi:MAG TPA: hypothetical protein VGJ91_04520 [Polyangiaceae bacterium]